MEISLEVLVVNINNIRFTRNLISDLRNQTVPCNVTLVDQGSIEFGTEDFLEIMKNDIRVIRNAENISLSEVWNNFYLNSSCKYLCFLNNDVKIPDNFVEDTVAIFEKEPRVDCVVHSTNHPDYTEKTPLAYVISKEEFCQGWDFSIRRRAYPIIPSDIKFFGGDDYIFDVIYKLGKKVAVALSSPIIHFHAKSRRFHPGDRDEEAAVLRKYVKERRNYYNQFSRKEP